MRASGRCFLQVFSAGVLLAGLAGCGDSNGPGGNKAPTADFTSDCTDLDCTFTNLSGDSDGRVTGSSWQFGDGAQSNSTAPSHAFAGDGSYQVTLTVTDNDGATGSVTKAVGVTSAQSGAPTAAFTVVCSSLDCTFTDQSTDGNGSVVAWAWEFGDGEQSNAQNPPVHHYGATSRTVYDAQLTVTDNDGLTSTKTAQITVSPPASLQCEDAPGTGSFASCDLVLEAAATVTVTLQSRSCDAHGNTFRITEPIQQTLFTDGCYDPAVGSSFDLQDGAAFAAGTHLQAEVVSGATNQLTSPALHVTGSYPTWTLSFDDGVGGPGEPDFNDLVMTVTAHPVP
ncbi:MAG TPA: PKD domain-containing protein [Gemmatimonadales bacterium]|nr:PKD domain-containing protein [Gemmatimonadales bacterium]